jgi:hypothetical protein
MLWSVSKTHPHLKCVRPSPVGDCLPHSLAMMCKNALSTPLYLIEPVCKTPLCHYISKHSQILTPTSLPLLYCYANLILLLPCLHCLPLTNYPYSVMWHLSVLVLSLIASRLVIFPAAQPNAPGGRWAWAGVPNFPPATGTLPSIPPLLSPAHALSSLFASPFPMQQWEFLDCRSHSHLLPLPLAVACLHFSSAPKLHLSYRGASPPQVFILQHNPHTPLHHTAFPLPRMQTDINHSWA